jgi:hypothetical protein
MHLTDHVTDVQLNEYLDNETTERAPIEVHLASCDGCAARLAALKALFVEIESLPELELTGSIAVRITPTASLPAPLPPSLTLTVTLQALAALIVLFIAAPVISNLMPPIQLPSINNVFIQMQTHWIGLLNLLFTFQLPTLPQFPVFEISSLVIGLTLTGVSMLWLIGNSLLLRRQIK